MEATIFGNLKVKITEESSKTWIEDNKEIHGHDPYVLEFFFRKISEVPNPVILDIGAHTGMFSLMSCFLPKATFYSFEPAPEAYRMLLDNLELNGVKDRVTTYSRALSDYMGSGGLKIPVDPKHYGLAVLGDPIRLKKLENYTVAVPVYTLDYFYSTNKLQHIDFIKMDTEGCELNILKGGKISLKSIFPIFLLRTICLAPTSFTILKKKSRNFFSPGDITTSRWAKRTSITYIRIEGISRKTQRLQQYLAGGAPATR